MREYRDVINLAIAIFALPLVLFFFWQRPDLLAVFYEIPDLDEELFSDEELDRLWSEWRLGYRGREREALWPLKIFSYLYFSLNIVANILTLTNKDKRSQLSVGGSGAETFQSSGSTNRTEFKKLSILATVASLFMLVLIYSLEIVNLTNWSFGAVFTVFSVALGVLAAAKVRAP